MDNELDRITNRGILERLLASYNFMWESTLAHGLREYGCAQSYAFDWFSIEQQASFLSGLNDCCVVLFARNLIALSSECPALMRRMKETSPRVARVVYNIQRYEGRLLEPNKPVLPVRPIVVTIALLSRQMKLSVTPTLARFIQLARIIMG